MMNSYVSILLGDATICRNINSGIPIISKLKPKNNPGSQFLSTKLLKFCKMEIAPLLTHVINLSLEQGIFPLELKVAKVIPIYKCEDSHIFGNYKPISLLPCLSKVFEKCVAHQIMGYLNNNGLFYDYQFGFRPKHSTETCLK